MLNVQIDVLKENREEKKKTAKANNGDLCLEIQ